MLSVYTKNAEMIRDMLDWGRTVCLLHYLTVRIRFEEASHATSASSAPRLFWLKRRPSLHIVYQVMYEIEQSRSIPWGNVKLSDFLSHIPRRRCLCPSADAGTIFHEEFFLALLLARRMA